MQQKWSRAKGTIGSSSSAPLQRIGIPEAGPQPDSVPAKAERLRAILERWRRPQRDAESFDTQVASVRAPETGFVCAVSVEDKPMLLACIAGCVSANLDAQIEACMLCEGDELRTNLDDERDAAERIHAWLEQDLASSSAGVAGSRSRIRPHLLQRIESAIQKAPPHLRTARSDVAARARSIATSQHSAAVEAELELLARSKLPDHEWLEAVVGLDHPSVQRTANPTRAWTIHALLLLQSNELGG